MATQIKPYGDQILVKPVEKAQVLVSERKSLCEYGEVLAVGHLVTDEIKVGDTLAFTVWGLNHIEIDNEKHYFVRELSEFILGKLEK